MSKIFKNFYETVTTVLQKVNVNQKIEKILCYEDSFITPSFFYNDLTFKNTQMSRNLANILILDNGELDKKILEDCINFLEKSLFSINESCELENLHRQHILFILKKLFKDKNFSNQLKRVFVPVQAHIQKLILDTLLLPKNTILSLAHVKRALLSSLFTYLRQNIGSCFATAPAILIQQFYPEKMLKDLDDLISSGSFFRILKEKTIVIPINLFKSLGSLYIPISIKKISSNPIIALSRDPSFQLVFSKINIINQYGTDLEKECLKLLNITSIQNLCTNPNNYVTAHDILFLSLAHYYNLPFKEIISFQKDYESLNNLDSHFSSMFTLAKETFINITHNALLKSWELSLASLAGAKANFSKQHLAIALGINNSKDNFSLSNILNNTITQEILKTQKDAEECESKYNNLNGQINYISTRLQHPLNKQDAENLIAEFRLRKQELHRVLSEWNEFQEKQKQLENLPNFIINFYFENLSTYFQSIYDPTITKEDDNFYYYEDKLAGFRIFYTYGRKNVGTWTPLYSENEFITALSNFFSSTEIDLKEKAFAKKLNKEIELCIREILINIQKQDFLLEAFQRIANFYNTSLPQNIMQTTSLTKHKPWAYVSGGSPISFLTAYFQLDKSPKYLLKQPESPQELLAFFADSIKDLPLEIKNYYLSENKAFFFSSSPTHLFTIDPANKMFRKCWDNDWYSYTWIRDVWENKQKQFLTKTLLDKGAIFTLLKKIEKKFINNSSYTSIFNEYFQDLNLNIPEFYQKTLRCFKENNIPHPLNIDQKLASLLFCLLPLTKEQQLEENITNLSQRLNLLSKISYKKFQNLIESIVPKFSLITATEFLFLYKILIINTFNSLFFEENLHFRLINEMRELSLLFPSPLILGDSNWEIKHLHFGFIVHPGTQEIDFWQFSPEGTSGIPMENWKKFFKEKYKWSFFSDPKDYGFISKYEDTSNIDFI